MASVDVRRQADESIGSAAAAAAAILGDALSEIMRPDQGKLSLVALGQPLTRPNRVTAYNAERDKLWAAFEKAGVVLPHGNSAEVGVTHSDDVRQFGGVIEFAMTDLSVALEVTRRENAVCIGRIGEPDDFGWERFLLSLEPIPKDSVELLRAAVRQIAGGLFVVRSFGQFDDVLVGAEVFAENSVIDQLEAVLAVTG
ncbi:hypothetical protein HC031_09045 [Planosporangium thailandense]|uniref:Uncharacterized protein n=1 Tax=Planosporangium thailandense TaxID=765197 RepID=A0ABX0XXF1_9ACTN|nr:hypothetical protein [Planosporangium thailandense]NJC69863.1 hypothetical protein [Planosporangium thailandense]